MKSDNLAIVTMKIERMSNKNQNKINMSFYTNAMWFMNTIRKNKIQKRRNSDNKFIRQGRQRSINIHKTQNFSVTFVIATKGNHKGQKDVKRRNEQDLSNI